MWLSLLGCFLLAALVSIALLVGALVRWPQLWLWASLRFSAGRWLLRFLQFFSVEGPGTRVSGYWLWHVANRHLCLVGSNLTNLGFEGHWVERSLDDLMALLDSDDRVRLSQFAKAFVARQQPVTVEFRGQASAGVKLWLQATGKALAWDRQGGASIVFGRFEEISERNMDPSAIAAMNAPLNEPVELQQKVSRQVEQSANDLKLRLQQVLDTAQVALCWKDSAGIYLGCNQKFADLVQEPNPENVIGKTDMELAWSDDVAITIAEDQDILHQRKTLVDKETELPNAAGTRFIKSHAAPLRDDSDSVIGVFRSYEDITVRRRMEALAHKERQLMQEILDSSNAMITIVDRHYCFLRINGYFEATMGLKAKDVVGKHVKEVIKGPKGDLVAAICDQIVATGLPVTEEYSVPIERGGRRSFIANVTPVFDESGKVDKLVTVSTDVTELKMAQVELEASRNKAEQAASVKSRFLANMSHEIRTPMNAILGFSQLALATSLDTKQLDYLTKIHFSAENLLGIVNDILDFSKIEAGKLTLEEKAFDLRVFLDNVCSIFEMKSKQKHLMFNRTILPNTPSFIKSDALRLHQILVNLIGNAIKFTHTGSVTLEVRMSVDMGERHILRFAVVDTGVGLSEAQMAQLFVAFEQVDAGVARQYGGTGLGLTISRRLVEMMGGEVKVSSVLGQGSRFEFSVNVGSASAEDVIERAAASVVDYVPDFQGAKLLLVEDNEVNLQVASEILAPFNLDIVTACNGAEAVQKVLARDFALVLMDIQMPVMDGYTATQKIRETFSDTQLPIIGLTANAMSEDRQASQRAGMNAHVAKPIDVRALVAALRRFLPERVRAPHRPETPEHYSINSGDSSNENDRVVALHASTLDVDEGVLRLRGRKDRYQELLLSFITQYQTVGQQCIDLIAQQGFADAKALVHQVKGVAGNLSAKKVYEESQALESLLADSAEPRDGAQLLAQGRLLQLALDELAEAIDKLCRIQN
ncbi:PAS domain-containing protein [Simiduia curdlanivorans]|uniref:histidine kinase n=1 Tax=Simiduia curdlanivorans TaxID=1492769 RepID=A0ABV8UYM5_9GAMM|nr:PAS domain-containing protein [Simiduia curdlanivorans]MDN3640402.1 PAS domain-containing protein [Simiduia curdlanivorans]